jgi:hypothetical protein
LSYSSPIIPSFGGDPTIFNKVNYPHLETINSFEGIIIPHPPLCCLSFNQCEGRCGITRTNFIWINGSVKHPPFQWGNCNLQFPPLLNMPMLNFQWKWKVPLVIYNSLLCWTNLQTNLDFAIIAFPLLRVRQARVQNSATATFLQGAQFIQQEIK